ncbi:facilitated trehalose transporter Tret1-like [Anthonomus grandis grandis]|uniref:facilitated trehalose transporter Tret1-like n=1 Tax=Anthonomus grandis grandis TaxID=2921223 RepID=UPI0021658F12|nr:facilitated trehalose transporter Tret1-like [Anthonomus grandis grandis]
MNVAKKSSETRKRGYFIYFAAFATSLTAYSTGAGAVWTSPILPKFQSADPEINPIGRPITTSESAWIVSASSLGMTFGPILSIIFSKKFPKKTLLIMDMVPIFFSHTIFAFANAPYMFIIGRFLSGLGTGAIWAILGSYIAEISEQRFRGILCSVPGVTSCFGSLVVYVIGPYMSMTYFSLVNVVPIVLFFICFGFFVPNSPYDLVIQKQPGKAEKSLKKFRSNESVSKELLFVEDYISNSSQDTAGVSFGNMLKDRSLRKGLFICMTLMALQQFSGFLIVFSYAELIFTLAGDFIPSSISAIIVSITAFIGNLLSISLIDKMGRKPLLAISTILQCICLFTLGLYFFLLETGRDVSNIGWLPVASVMMTMFGFNLALGIVPWVITGEVFHSSVKPFATTVTSLTNFSLGFVLTLCFPYLIQIIGLAWTFWIFAAGTALTTVFTIFVLPETKGKNFKEILEILKK